MRAIDADILKLAIVRNLYGCNQYELVQQLIDAQPTIGPAKHGHWILDETIKNPRYQIKTCSLCGCRVNGTEFNFCPKCGSKMDGDKNAGA